MTGLLILLGVLVVVEVLGLPVLVVLYLTERGRIAQRLNALTSELARLRSAMAGATLPAQAQPKAAAPAATPAAAPTRAETAQYWISNANR